MTAKTDLERELHGPVTALSALSEEEAADLLMLFRAASQRETSLLAAAIDAMIGALPRPLRAITKRIMFGDLNSADQSAP